ncbi:MAG TPA: hypothetical protein VHT49_05925 [Acidimicrobiales bacterium]|nr:hypothetical protein [Acidimicrobiales bacterium]
MSVTPASLGDSTSLSHDQPASRYWAFQWYETAIFVGLDLVLVGLCFWWIQGRRRRGRVGDRDGPGRGQGRPGRRRYAPVARLH